MGKVTAWKSKTDRKDNIKIDCKDIRFDEKIIMSG
jgi:hypothetical protein